MRARENTSLSNNIVIRALCRPPMINRQVQVSTRIQFGSGSTTLIETSVADPYNFDADPDPGKTIRIRIQGNYTDPDPGKIYGSGRSGSTITDRMNVLPGVMFRW